MLVISVGKLGIAPVSSAEEKGKKEGKKDSCCGAPAVSLSNLSS